MGKNYKNAFVESDIFSIKLDSSVLKSSEILKEQHPRKMKRFNANRIDFIGTLKRNGQLLYLKILTKNPDNFQIIKMIDTRTFICDRCGFNKRVLYSRFTNELHFACRDCLKIKYASQQISKNDIDSWSIYYTEKLLKKEAEIRQKIYQGVYTKRYAAYLKLLDKVKQLNLQ